MLAQKISVSLDSATMSFVEGYLKRHREKSRSQVIGEALQLLQHREQQAELEAAYSMSASADRLIAAEFSSSDRDGLEDEAW